MAPYAYQLQVIERAQQALTAAVEQLAGGRLRLANTRFEMGVNRRQETARGIVLGVAEEKPRARELQIASIETANQWIVLFSHPCHPYVLGAESRWISGDFAGQACQSLEADGAIAMFLNGCAGDIAPRRAFQGLQAAQGEGERMAAAVREGLAMLDAFPSSVVSGAHAWVHLPYAEWPTSEDLARIEGQGERVVRSDERAAEAVQVRLRAARRDWRRAIDEVNAGSRALEPILCELQRLDLGGLRILGVAGEPFYIVGERLRATSPVPTWSLGTCNAYCGYIPSEEESASGGYETDDSWQYLGIWRPAAGAERRLQLAAQRVLGPIL